mmetsp:Transcript_16446/g.40180  ORF Transcript_16446/g.40180 Transcript_16446/m.40180 type:complete len:139 (+) Transcript_16446:824-1240(+)
MYQDTCAINQALFYNHAMLHHINELAREKKRVAPFPQYKALESNNGEVFLSKYFRQQTERSKLEKRSMGSASEELCKRRTRITIQFQTTSSSNVENKIIDTSPAASPVVNPAQHVPNAPYTLLKDHCRFQMATPKLFL